MFAPFPLNIDTKDVFLAVDQLFCNGEYKKQQKYGVALLRQKSFTSVPNRVYDTREEDEKRIIAQLPKKLLDLEVPRLWVLNIQAAEDGKSMLAPHTDIGRVTTVNFYSNTNGERTCFYEYGAGGAIKEVGSFVAKDGEAWVLDVSNPHGVELVKGKTRRVLSLSFLTTPFDKVMEALS